jgi:hypothetical protein
MIRWLCRTTVPTVLLGMLMMPSVRAQEGYVALRPSIRPASQLTPLPESAAAVAVTAVPTQAGYVHLGAPMYPSPQPNIPIWTGATFIPTPALAPHEMLYPHTYRALYPPFYHRVKGHYYWTPFGMKSHEKWQLQGTLVQVKYRSHYPLFHGFHPPKISTIGPEWK